MSSVWIVKDHETLPIPGTNGRRMRAGLLAANLAARGHEVRWFTSAFGHFQKKTQTSKIGAIKLDDGTTLHIVPAVGYKNNISLRRIVHSAAVAYHISRAFKTLEPPDLIVLDFPTPDCAAVVAAYSERTGVPFLVCVRDLWPDFFRNMLGPALGFLASPYLRRMDRQAKRAFKKAVGVIGISNGYLEFGLKKAGRERHAGDALFPLGYPASEASPELQLRAQAKLNEIGVDLDKPIAAFAGTLGRTYNLTPVIAAWNEGKIPPDWQLLILGAGDDLTRYRRQAAGNPRITLAGYVDGNMIAPILERAEIALAAYADGAPQELPNKIFEYLSCGCPIISSLGGEAEALLDTFDIGITYATAQDFADAFNRIAKQTKTERAMKSSRAKEVFLSKFDERQIYGGYVSHIENILAGNLKIPEIELEKR